MYNIGIGLVVSLSISSLNFAHRTSVKLTENLRNDVEQFLQKKKQTNKKKTNNNQKTKTKQKQKNYPQALSNLEISTVIFKTIVFYIKNGLFISYSSSSGARSGTDIGDHASPNISVIRQLQKI